MSASAESQNNQRILDALQPMSKTLGMPSEWLQVIANHSRLTYYKAGEILQFEGDPPQAMYIFLSGRAKVFRMSQQGREQVILVARAGDHVNLVPMIDEGPCPATVQTLTDAEALVCTLASFKEILTNEPRIAIVMMKELARLQRKMVQLIEELSLHTVQSRLARMLIDNSNNNPPHITMTQSDMASQIGTVREMIARTLKTFDGLGLIKIQQGQIMVVDRLGLKEKIAD
jgi:CRP-like cAMP-binding protein